MAHPTVTQSNHLIEASYRLTLNEQRLLLACIAQLDPRKPMPKGRLTVYAADFAATYGLAPHKAFEHLREAADRLYERDLRIHHGPKRERYRWVDHVRYHAGEGHVSIHFTQWVTPYLTRLNREFTSYRLQCVSALRSTYAVRLYQMLIQYRDFGERTISVDDLRERLELSDKYSRFANMKARVIAPAVKELNEKSNLRVEWRARREGRRVESLTFRFGERPQLALDLEA